MIIVSVIAFFGGIALFLFGITLMGDGLKKVAGDKLELFLYKLTSNAFKGMVLGVGVTAVIQSSSATSIMTIGFVNSGMMKFRQAVSIILGSILGTSITGWIVCLSAIEGAGGWVALLSTATITGIVAIIGIYLRKFTKSQVKNQVGEILMGFAVLMYGMTAITNAVKPFVETDSFMQVLTAMANPILGILVGMAFTALIQSSAAAVGILQALAMTGVLQFQEAFPMLLGIAVGGAVPVLISALGANVNGVRTALVHLLIDFFGALICGVVFYALNAVLHFALMGFTLSAVSMALLNTMFRFVVVVVLFPCVGLLEKLACAIVKDREEEKRGEDLPEPIAHLEERFIQHPALALEQSHQAIDAMALLTQQCLQDAFDLLNDYSEEGFQEVRKAEKTVDVYEDSLGAYIVQISARELSKKQNEQVYAFLHSITDFERISDHALNVAECAQEIHEKEMQFSDAAIRELKILREAITEVVSLATSAFVNSDMELAARVEPLEELIDNLCDEMKNHHVDRLQRGECVLEKGFVFNDLITNYERISDHCSNIAVGMIELDSENFDTHKYLSSLKKMKDETFTRYFEEYRDRFSI
ncbi:MAG: Na/Pi cotransporter family protein [Firmicutes bacterium]|nr:Na/Pi cotransporter family protein [Bacillota bacterium]